MPPIYAWRSADFLEELTFLDEPPSPVPAGKPLALRVRATNRSAEPWELKPGDFAGIHLSYLVANEQLKPIGGGQATRIMGGLSFESQPTWSPDGRTIAFLTDRSGVENLWIANADGSNPRAVSKDGRTNDRPQIMVSPAWTPDGNYIVVSKSRPPEPGTFGLFMYHRDGGTGVRVGPAPPPRDAAR